MYFVRYKYLTNLIMAKKKINRAVKAFENSVLVCGHLYEVESLELGFNFPEDIQSDSQAWYDKCEEKFNKERGWTKAALKFADFHDYCYTCLMLLRDLYLEKLKTGKPGKYKLWY